MQKRRAMHRLFIGLRPPREIRDLLRRAMGGVAGARWQEDDQLHLTLRYVGEVDRRTAEEVALAVSRVHAPVIETAIAGVGCFDKNGRTDALWAGVADPAPIAALHRKVDQALVRIGLPAEGRAFVPHVTLARLPRSLGSGSAIDAFLAREAALSSPRFMMAHLILFESHLSSDRARYDTVGRWPLG